MQKTLVIIKPSAVRRELVGEVIARFERKGLRLAGIKMMQLTDEILNQHYAHLADKPFFLRVKQSMMLTPVVVTCWEAPDAVKAARNLIGITNGCDAQPGTIRGDFSVNAQENIVHASDSDESAQIELKRFFGEGEIFDYDYLSYNIGQPN